ncbi:hypothetical protein BDN67DRAFT_363234 [Paxillus ammoniavirescens]|nr:hypothetical protein BDN67DRAFT_363234 [Paxillus ammoniavirescens]
MSASHCAAPRELRVRSLGQPYLSTPPSTCPTCARTRYLMALCILSLGIPVSIPYNASTLLLLCFLRSSLYTYAFPLMPSLLCLPLYAFPFMPSSYTYAFPHMPASRPMPSYLYLCLPLHTYAFLFCLCLALSICTHNNQDLYLNDERVTMMNLSTKCGTVPLIQHHRRPTCTATRSAQTLTFRCCHGYQSVPVTGDFRGSAREGQLTWITL